MRLGGLRLRFGLGSGGGKTLERLLRVARWALCLLAIVALVVAAAVATRSALAPITVTRALFTPVRAVGAGAGLVGHPRGYGAPTVGTICARRHGRVALRHRHVGSAALGIGCHRLRLLRPVLARAAVGSAVVAAVTAFTVLACGVAALAASVGIGLAAFGTHGTFTVRANCTFAVGTRGTFAIRARRTFTVRALGAVAPFATPATTSAALTAVATVTTLTAARRALRALLGP